MKTGRGRASHADFIGISRKVVNSPAFIALPPIARALYLDLRRQFNGYNNGQIAAVLKGTTDQPGLAQYGWARRSVFRTLNVLSKHGLIEKTRQGGINYLSKTCSLYAFTDLPVVASKEKGVAGSMASLAYLRFTEKEREQEKMLGANVAPIGANVAPTQGPNWHCAPVIGANVAPSDFRSKADQPFDASAKSGQMAKNCAKSAYGPGWPTLISLPRGDAEPGGDATREIPAQGEDQS